MPWWKEPTKDQWLAWWAAWTPDALDFTIFLLIMVPISMLVVTPFHLLTDDYLTLAIGFSVQGLFGGAIHGQNPSAFRPSCARWRPDSATIRARSLAAWWRRC